MNKLELSNNTIYDDWIIKSVNTGKYDKIDFDVGYEWADTYKHVIFCPRIQYRLEYSLSYGYNDSGFAKDADDRQLCGVIAGVETYKKELHKDKTFYILTDIMNNGDINKLKQIRKLILNK